LALPVVVGAPGGIAEYPIGGDHLAQRVRPVVLCVVVDIGVLTADPSAVSVRDLLR
jgi:hypothetical protein